MSDVFQCVDTIVGRCFLLSVMLMLNIPPFLQNGADHSEKAATEVAEEKHENGNGTL